MATQIPPSSNTSAQSLWDQAYNSLGADLKTSLGQAATHKRDILAATLEAAETRKTTSLRRRWKFKRSNGEVVIVRDVLEKIAKWIDSFKAVGDAAVQFDASNASLPWAAVRLLLQVTVNDVQQYGTMVQDLEVVSRIIARYKEFENLHLGRDELAQPALGTALTVLYTEVLTYLAQTIAFFSQSTAVRLAKSVFWTGDDGIQKILSREDEVLKLAKLQDTSDLRFIQKTVLRLRDQVNSNTKRIEEDEYIKMISWMSTSPFSIHHETMSDSRTLNFGQWLLKHEAYRNWCESSSSSPLWIHGITGSGKTNLFSVIVDSLRATWASQPESTPFAYFYCLKSESEPERSSADGILRSILRQLAIAETQSDVRDFFYSDFQRRSRSALLQGLDLPKLSTKECVDRIVQVANEDPITVLLDGVEQVEDESCDILLQCLSDIISRAENVVKVLITSRNSLDILSSLPTAKEIIVTADLVHEDMTQFITQKIDDTKIISGRLSPDKRSCLTKELLEGAGEMFLWIHRQIQQLRKVKNEHDLLPALRSNILSDLDTLYENDLGQILQSGDTSRQLAIQTFSWLLYMKSPLTPEALLAAVSETSIRDVPYTAADISAVCSNLVVIDLRRQVVRLAHHSVREFILRTKQSLFSAPVAHSLLASTCIKVSARGPPDSGSLEQQVGGFFFYSATHWAGHFESSRVIKKEEKLFQDMISFVFEDDDYDVSLSFEAWLDTAKEIARLLPRDHPMKPALDAIPNETSSPLFLAAVFGIDGLLTLIAESESDIDWDQRNGLGHTALYLAAATGHLSTVMALIEKGAKQDVECGTYGSPLHVACFRGYQDIVEMLLQHGTSPKCGSKFQSAIQAASQGGHEDIVLSLIRHDIINSQDDYEQAIQMATQYGFIKVIDQLLKPEFKHFVDKDTPDKHKMRLAKAIKAGQIFVLQRQISKVSPGAADTFPKDAVAIAALYGHTDMVKYLLEQGLEIEAKGQFGTPLRSACLMNHRSTVEELLKRGAKINTEERKGNALYVAAAKGHVDIVRILLDEDADLHQKTGSCGTALHAAAYHGHRKVVEMLLDAGANVHAEGSSPDAFHAAAEGGHQNIIMLFLERGYRFLYEPPSPKYKRAQPSPYRPLYREVSPGRDKHPRSKLWPHLWKRTARTPEPGSRTDARDNITRVETDDEMEMIAIDQRSSLHDDENRQDGYRKNRPLTASAARGRDAVLVILLRQKETLGFMDYEVDAALKAAASNGHLNTVRILLDHALKMKGPFIQRIYSTLENIPEGRHDILQLTLAKALESGCTEEQIDQLRLKLPPGKERYKVAVIEQQVLTADLLECCTSGNVAALEAIMNCKHQQLLQANELLEGLQKAAERGHGSVIRSLFKLSSHLQRADIPDDTLISAAGKDLEILKFLLSQKVDVSKSEFLLSRLIYTACRKGQPDIIEYLISNFGIDVNTNIPEDEKPRRFRRMRQSADPRLTSAHITTTDGADGSTPTNDSRLVSLLQVSLGAFDTYEIPYYARWYRDKTMPQQQKTIQTLLRLGADPNSLGGKDVYPLPYAARICPGVVVKELLEAGADVKLAGQGDLALLGAVQREMEAMAVMNRLLDNGHPLPDYFDRGKALLDKVLKFFEGDRGRQTFHSIIDDPDGRFEQAPSLEYIFEQGPGAVLEFLLQKYDTGKLEDTRYGLVLQMACAMGRAPLVELLLSRGVGVDATGYYYGSSLQAAARTGQLQIAKKLLDKGANPNVIQGRWHTSLHAAIVGGYLEIVQLLLQHGADPKLQFRIERQSHSERGLASSSTLQFALQEGHTEIARLLLDTDPSLVQEEGRLQHPLIISCQKGYDAMTELLLEANAPFDVRGHKEANVASMEVQDASPLHAAISGGHVNVVKALLLRGADANLEVDDCDCQTPLLAAIQRGDLRIIRVLLDSGAKLHSYSLQRACRSGDLAIVEALLEQLFNDGEGPFEIIDETLDSLTMEKFTDYRTLNLVLDYVPPTPKRFLLVCSSGPVPLVRRMIQQGISVDGSDEEEDSPLQVACYYLNFEVVRLLLQRGANVRSRSSQPGDPITLALWACALPLQQQLEQRGTRHQKYRAESADYRSIQRCTSIVRILLECGATADGGTHEMESPLQLASFIGNLEIFKLLIKHGASVDKITGSFKTPLFSALQGNNSDIISLILEKGVDVNYVHPIHGSALHLACQYNDEPVVFQLLQHGASPDLKDANGVTALTLALESAASYYGASQNISRLICRHSTTLDITDSDIIAAARVEPSDLLSFLLDRRGEEPVTEDLVIRFLREERRPIQENLEVLFDRSQGLEITPKMLNFGLSEQAFGSLIQARQLSVDITPDILESQTDLGTLKALIGYQPDVEVTEGLVIKILSIVPRYSRWWQREESTELLLSLWHRDLPLSVTNAMLKAAKSLPHLEFLLERLGSAQGQLQDVAVWICEQGTDYSGTRDNMLALVLKVDPKVDLSLCHLEKIMVGAKPLMLDMVLTHTPSLPITEKLFLSIFRESPDALEYTRKGFAEVLIRHKKKFVFTEKIREAIDMAYQKHSDMDKRDTWYSLRERDETREEAEARQAEENDENKNGDRGHPRDNMGK